ncbi:MAG TPA: enoyl-CoA hydratase/isomerase family protein, partial [Vicingus sp.]|nr:enoyl-CoA hydratase/isomerase family protein [Vicingus sp.]
MAYNNIIIEKKEKLAVLTINRPNQLNALNKETISELSNAFKTLEADKSVRVIIITGSGEKAFVAGADIKEFYQFDINQG